MNSKWVADVEQIKNDKAHSNLAKQKGTNFLQFLGTYASFWLLFFNFISFIIGFEPFSNDFENTSNNNRQQKEKHSKITVMNEVGSVSNWFDPWRKVRIFRKREAAGFDLLIKFFHSWIKGLI